MAALNRANSILVAAAPRQVLATEIRALACRKMRRGVITPCGRTTTTYVTGAPSAVTYWYERRFANAEVRMERAANWAARFRIGSSHVRQWTLSAPRQREHSKCLR